MSYRPGARPCSHLAARSAPCAKVARLLALWVISTRSPMPANSTVWSPTMSPPRTVAKPMVDGVALAGDAFAPVDGAACQIAAQARATTSPMPQRGAGRRIDLVAVMRLDDLDVVAVRQHLGGEFGSFISRFTPTLMLGANTTGICCAAAAMRARPASSNPVVPITSGTPAATQASR